MNLCSYCFQFWSPLYYQFCNCLLTCVSSFRLWHYGMEGSYLHRFCILFTQWRPINPFFNKYLLSIYYVPGSNLGTEDALVCKTDVIPVLGSQQSSGKDSQLARSINGRYSAGIENNVEIGGVVRGSASVEKIREIFSEEVPRPEGWRLSHDLGKKVLGRRKGESFEVEYSLHVQEQRKG